MIEGLDPQLEKMILKGIKQQLNFTSSTEAKLTYRAVSDIEKRDALSHMVDEFGIQNREEYDYVFSAPEESSLSEKEEESLSEEEEKEVTIQDRLMEIGVNPVIYRKGFLLYNIVLVYYGIKDFYPSLQAVSEEEGINFVSKWTEEDINKLAGLILDISGATEENVERINKFPDRYATPQSAKVNDPQRI